jgi:glutamate synthase domain-containing protein 3
MTVTKTDKGPIEGYVVRKPEVLRDGETATIDCQSTYYRQINEAVRAAFDDGVKTVVLNNVNGQRYIGTGIRGKGLRIEVHGTPGQDMAMFMDGPTIEVFGNAQDGVGNTMNSGKVVVHGSAGDVLGYGMRGGRVFIKGDVGYRVGIHMKAYEDLRPIMVAGGKARDFFGEYMAGGLLVLLGVNSHLEGPMVGGYLGTGMHGGTIYVRGEVEPWQCGKEVGVFVANEADMAELTPVLTEYCTDMGMDLDEVLSVPFTKLVPVSHRPYGKLYTYL